MATINGTILPDIIVGTSKNDTINGFAEARHRCPRARATTSSTVATMTASCSATTATDILIGGRAPATLLSVYNGSQGNDPMIATDLGVAEDFDGEDGIDTVSFAARDLGVTATFLSVLGGGVPLLDNPAQRRER